MKKCSHKMYYVFDPATRLPKWQCSVCKKLIDPTDNEYLMWEQGINHQIIATKDMEDAKAANIPMTKVVKANS